MASVPKTFTDLCEAVEKAVPPRVYTSVEVTRRTFHHKPSRIPEISFQIYLAHYPEGSDTEYTENIIVEGVTFGEVWQKFNEIALPKMQKMVAKSLSEAV